MKKVILVLLVLFIAIPLFAGFEVGTHVDNIAACLDLAAYWKVGDSGISLGPRGSLGLGYYHMKADGFNSFGLTEMELYLGLGLNSDIGLNCFVSFAFTGSNETFYLIGALAGVEYQINVTDHIKVFFGGEGFIYAGFSSYDAGENENGGSESIDLEKSFVSPYVGLKYVF